MTRWHFKWWHFFALYGALIFINAVTAITEKEIGTIGAYLTVLAMFFVAASLFYQALKKKATTQGGSAMTRWHFKWWHVLALYCAAFILLNGVMAILEKEIGTIGAYLTILAMFLVCNLLYHARRKNATDAD